MNDVQRCTACDRMSHSHVLSAENGSLEARILFVAEAVGRRGGAVTGIPLTRDASGKRFDAFLRVAGIQRADVFITNAILCNPLDAGGANRAPLASEIARCRPFLARTLELVRAPLVVTLGRVALDALGELEPHGLSLRSNVGSPIAWNGRDIDPLVPSVAPIDAAQAPCSTGRGLEKHGSRGARSRDRFARLKRWHCQR